MSSTKDKFKKAFAKFKSTKPPLDPGAIDKMEGTDEEKLALLTHWAAAEEKLLRALHNPRITGTITRSGNVTSYNYTGQTRILNTDEWNNLLDQELQNEPKNETDTKRLMWKLNALHGVSSLLGQGNPYAKRFMKARDLKFLIKLCTNR